MNVADYTMHNGWVIKVLIVGEHTHGTVVKFFDRGFVASSAKPTVVETARLHNIRPA